MVEDEPLHGYAIMEALRARSDGNLDVPTGTLYPALRRLERAGYLRSEWTRSELGGGAATGSPQPGAESSTGSVRSGASSRP